MPALRQDQHLVPELGGFLEIVGDDHDGFAELVLNRDQAVLQANPGDRVDRAERLVHEQHRRIGGERPCHADALLLSAGHVLG